MRIRQAKKIGKHATGTHRVATVRKAFVRLIQYDACKYGNAYNMDVCLCIIDSYPQFGGLGILVSR